MKVSVAIEEASNDLEDDDDDDDVVIVPTLRLVSDEDAVHMQCICYVLCYSSYRVQALELGASHPVNFLTCTINTCTRTLYSSSCHLHHTTHDRYV